MQPLPFEWADFRKQSDSEVTLIGEAGEPGRALVPRPQRSVSLTMRWRGGPTYPQLTL